MCCGRGVAKNDGMLSATALLSYSLQLVGAGSGLTGAVGRDFDGGSFRRAHARHMDGELGIGPVPLPAPALIKG